MVILFFPHNFALKHRKKTNYLKLPRSTTFLFIYYPKDCMPLSRFDRLELETPESIRNLKITRFDLDNHDRSGFYWYVKNENSAIRNCLGRNLYEAKHSTKKCIKFVRRREKNQKNTFSTLKSR